MTAFDPVQKEGQSIEDGPPTAPTSSPSSEDTTDTHTIDWAPSDPENPYNWSYTRKCVVTAVGILATFTTTMNGTMITVAHEAINETFNISDEHFPNSYWPVTSWALGGALTGFIILPLMEDFGVRPAFLTTYVVFILFVIPQAVAQKFATLIITRFFSGGCVSVLANTSAALIGNIWEGDRPVIAGVIYANLGWRWLSYMQVIWYGALLPVYVFFFQESRGTIILQRRALKLQKQGKMVRGPLDTGGKTLSIPAKMVRSTKRPLRMLFTEPVLFTFTLWSAFMLGTVFLFTQSVEQVFSGLYGWNASQAGYLQAAIVVGEFIGWTGALISAKLYFSSVKRNVELPGTPIPEARLYVSAVGSFVGVAGGMFVFGWTSYPSIPWIAPAIGLAMVGYGINVVVIAIVDYVCDAYTKYAGSAVACIVLGENLFVAFLPLAAQPMYSNLGFRWASSLLGFLALVLSSASVCILFWGRRLRERSVFMREAMVEKREIVRVVSNGSR